MHKMYATSYGFKKDFTFVHTRIPYSQQSTYCLAPVERRSTGQYEDSKESETLRGFPELGWNRSNSWSPEA
jgi:hypothetical protein